MIGLRVIECKRSIGLVGLGYTTRGDMMDVKGFMDWDFRE
jgi:hypothetical protein